MQSPTLWMLMAEYNSPTAYLEDCLHHLGYSTIGEANRAARDGKLPVPTFRVTESKRAKYKVHLEDLATMIDNARAKGVNTFKALSETTGNNKQRSQRVA